MPTDDSPYPANLTEFVLERLRGLAPSARLALVLDPGARLELESTITLDRRTFVVTKYTGNDLAFRKNFKTDDRAIVWITATPSESDHLLDLSSLMELFHQADLILDANLVGVLTTLVPNQVWPDSIEQYGDLICAHLDHFLDAFNELSPHLRGLALDIHAIRALVLHCLQPEIAPNEFLFKQDTINRVLVQYVTLLWKTTWDETGSEILCHQARESSLIPLGDLAPWFDLSAASIAQFLYLYRFLNRARVPNIVNQIRGLQVLDFDPESLEKSTGAVFALWSRDANWRNRVIAQAEGTLELADIRRIAGLLDLSSPSKIADAITNAETPLLIYCLGAQLLESAQRANQLPSALAAWLANRPTALNGLADTLPQNRSVNAIASILDEVAFISARISTPLDPPKGLAQLLDWYINGKYYELELAHARALFALNRLPEEAVRENAQKCLDNLRAQLREYLDGADHELGRQISGNWSEYTNSPRLSTYVLIDHVRRARLRPTPSACLWFIVFDGMRYDTWERVVKPRLLERFEIKKDKAYFCPLPSWTKVARTSLMAGKLPDWWLSYRKAFTADQGVLASQFFELDERAKDQKLRFFSRMESDRTARTLDRTKRFPYNVLVFNISDDDLHKQSGHLGQLNQSIETTLNSAMEFLDGLVNPDDTIIVSSDHGFTELEPGDGILIKEDQHWQRYVDGSAHPVHYRYISGVDAPSNLPIADTFSFEYSKMRDGKFTVAIGRKWFRRAESNQTSRYDHGGISFAEMVVPGAVLQLVTEKKIDLAFDDLPAKIQVAEGKEERVNIRIKNKGNQPGEFELTYSTNTDTTTSVTKNKLGAGGYTEVAMVIRPVMQKGKSLTESLKLILKYTAIDGRLKTSRKEIPIVVKERRDIVEISFGGLDDLDKSQGAMN